MPKITMRHYIFATIILILACNGIACACPSEISIDDKSSHQMHGDMSSDDQTGCCDNCDEMTAAKEHGDYTLFTPEKSKHHDFEALNELESEIDWSRDPVTRHYLTNRYKPTPHSTPVMFYDRMLD